MKKNYLIGTLIAASALTLVAQSTISNVLPSFAPRKAVTVENFPSNPAIAEGQFAEGWTVINANDDDITWEAVKVYSSVDYIAAKTGYTPSGSHNMDDYLISPAVALESGQKYTVAMEYSMGGWSDADNLKVYVSLSAELDKIKTLTPIWEKEDFNQYDLATATMEFTPEADGDYYLVFYTDSKPYQSGVSIKSVKILGQVAPNPVTDLTVTPAADKSISCTLSWTLPTTNNAGGTLTSIEKVIVYRDEVSVKELSGSATSFTDSETEGLTGGEHTYGVVVVADGTESAMAESPAVYVGPIKPVALPHAFSFASENDFNNWVVIKGSKSTNSSTWTYNSARNYAQYSITYSWMTPATDDDWLIAPPVMVEEAGYFKVVLQGVKSATAAAKFNIVMGSAPTADMTPLGDTFDLHYSDALTPDFSDAAAQTSVDIYLEPGTYYFGVHNCLGTNHSASTYYKLGGLKIEASAYSPGAITALTAKGADDYSRNLVVSWDNPTVDNAGAPMGSKEFVVKVFVNGSAEPAKIINDGSTSCTIPVEADGCYTVSVVTEAPDGVTSGKKVVATSSWVGNPFAELPISTSFKSDDKYFEMWKSNIIDGNEDGYTFELVNVYNWGDYIDVLRTQQGAYTYDDYILSPYLALNAGTYKVTIEWESNGYSALDAVLGFVEAGAFDKDATSDLVKTFTLDSNENETRNESFIIPTAGNYQLVIGHKGTNSYAMDYLRVSSLEISEDVVYPADVTDLAVAANPDNEEEAIISWTNPTTCYDSEDALTAIEAIVVMRDGEMIAVIDDAEKLTPGAECSYTDKLEQGGIYTYTVYPTVNGRGHGGKYPTVTSGWIGGGLESLEMEPEDDRWSFIDTHSDHDAALNMYGWCISGPYLYYHNDGQGNDADDYLVTPPVRIAAGNIYEVSVDVYPNPFADTKEYAASIKMGTGSDPVGWNHVHPVAIAADAANVVAIPHKFNVAVANAEAAAMAPMMKVEGEEEDPAKALFDGAVKLPAGSHTIAIHATQAGGMRVGKLTFKKVAEYTAPTTGLENVAADNFTFDGTTATFSGVRDVEIYSISGALIHRAPACDGQFTIPALTPGCYILKAGSTTLKVNI